MPRGNAYVLTHSVGGTLSAPLLGRFVDAKGATIPLIGASVCLLVGYTGIQRIYDNGIGTETSISTVSFSMLIVCLLLNGLATGGASAAINTTAKSFPKSAVSHQDTYVSPVSCDFFHCSTLQQQALFCRAMGSQHSFFRPSHMRFFLAIPRPCYVSSLLAPPYPS